MTKPMNLSEAREIIKMAIRDAGIAPSAVKPYEITLCAWDLLEQGIHKSYGPRLGAIRRNRNLTPQRRSEIASKAAKARWAR